MPAEIRREHLLAVGPALFVAHAVEAGAVPGRRVAFDDERAHARAVAIVVRNERAVLVGAERERQAIEHPGRAVPGELVGERVDPRPEALGVQLAAPSS